MPLIKNRQLIESDPWYFVKSDETPPSSQPLVWPLRDLTQPPSSLAVACTTEDDISSLLNWVDQLQMIAIEFPAFRDGRGFSLARLIRRAGFQGELRARGAVLRDQFAFLESCGFNAFELTEQQLSATDLQAFAEISVRYPGQPHVA
ncbi:DUF934 domain-containing protein [Marinospirillum sp.]|uniref:DUF934 domain-containing protein n=1 Tax=Marinospirillum sp. TaxID=2183934 RepID=UPI003A86F451